MMDAVDPEWQEKTRDMVLDQENRAFAFRMPNLRDISDRMRVESVEGCFICLDAIAECPTPQRCGIGKPEAKGG